MVSASRMTNILVVGERRPVFSGVLVQLNELGGGTKYEAPVVLKEQRVAIVLSRTTLPSGNPGNVIPGVLAARSSLFLSFPIEHGCWWVPVFSYGRLSCEASAFRAREFSEVLLATARRMLVVATLEEMSITAKVREPDRRLPIPARNRWPGARGLVLKVAQLGSTKLSARFRVAPSDGHRQYDMLSRQPLGKGASKRLV
jgi:hypothetical protein